MMSASKESFATDFENVLKSNDTALLAKYISVYFCLLDKHGAAITNCSDIICRPELFYQCFLVWVNSIKLNNAIEIHPTEANHIQKGNRDGIISLTEANKKMYRKRSSGCWTVGVVKHIDINLESKVGPLITVSVCYYQDKLKMGKCEVVSICGNVELLCNCMRPFGTLLTSLEDENAVNKCIIQLKDYVYNVKGKEHLATHEQTPADLNEPEPFVEGTGKKSRCAPVDYGGPKKVKRVKVEEEEKDVNDWVCAICHQLHALDGSNSDLLMCDGGCLRSFHTSCLDIANRIPEGSWSCEQCSKKCHSCFVCGGESTADKPVLKCNKNTCGRHYHKNCITDNYSNYEIHNHLAEDGETETVSFVCPSHFCDVCFDIYGKRTKGSIGPVLKCICCPIGYHIGCMMPGSRANHMCLLCPEHPEISLPSVDVPQTIKKVSTNFTNKKNSKYNFDMIWEQMSESFADNDHEPHSEDINDPNHFLLPLSIKTEVNHQTPVFKEISRLDFETFPGKEKALLFHETEEQCECKDKCDEKCLNRLLHIECYSSNKSCSLKLESSKGNCNVGGNCGNRQLQNKNYIKVKPFVENGMGWGLKTAEAVAKGTLVIEYVGEVINDATMQQRMESQRINTPSDHDFYIMELEKGVYVDGKFKGNYSRFINHSCEPNCELVRVVVKGRMRIGIYAIKDIANGEALSYDYQFDTQEASSFKCCCGSKLCRGTMAPKSKLEVNLEKFKKLSTNKSQLKHERQKLIDLGKSLTVKTKSQEVADEWSRCCYLSKNLPEDPLYEIRNGALTKDLHVAQRSHILLKRNLITKDLKKERKANQKNGVVPRNICGTGSSGLGGDSGAFIVKRWRKLMNKRANFLENSTKVVKNVPYLEFHRDASVVET